MSLGEKKGKINLNSLILQQVKCFSNQQGALVGGISALLIMVWISLHAQHDIATGDLKFAVKELSIDQCSYNFSAVAEVPNLTIKVDEGR